MIEPNSVQNFIDAIQLSSTQSQPTDSTASNQGYIGRTISLIKNYFSKEITIHQQFENITRTLNAVGNKKSLEDNDVALLNHLKETLLQVSLPEILRSDKEKLLKVINHLQEFKENLPLDIEILPLDTLTLINSYNPHVKGETSVDFLKSRQELFLITANACQESSMLKSYLPEKKGTNEDFVKGIYNNLISDISQFSGYEDKKQELRVKYGSSMTVKRLEEMSQWVQAKHDEHLISVLRFIAEKYAIRGQVSPKDWKMVEEVMEKLENILNNSEDVSTRAKTAREWIETNQRIFNKVNTISFENFKENAKDNVCSESLVVPKEIGLFRGLEILNLNRNNIKTIPKEIGQLSQLEVLSLKDNNLTTIPSEIFQLSELQQLFVSNNNLTIIPSEIDQLSELVLLNVSNNNLTTIPSEIGQLSELEQFYVDNNNLTTIPSEIDRLKKLVIINVSNNNLTTIPSEIGQLSVLKKFYFSNNHLTIIPSEIGQLSELVQFDVSNNNLTTIPEEVKKLSKLLILDVSNNNLTSIPEEVKELSELLTLDVSNNNLTSIPKDMDQMNSLRSFFISEDQQTLLPTEMKNSPATKIKE